MNIPEVLYKYTSADTTNTILSNGSLRWSNPYEFNDLLEFQRMPEFSPTVEERYHDYVELLVDHIYENISLDIANLTKTNRLLIESIASYKKEGISKNKLLQEFINIRCPITQADISAALRENTNSWNNERARILCLSSEADNQAMWGLYADNHFGCVLGFRSDFSNNSPFSEAKPVKYTEGAPVIDDGINFLLYGDTPKLRMKTFEAIFYSKSIHWAYENEWRLITWRHQEKGEAGDYKFYNDELESITFGNRTTREYRDKLKKLAINISQNCTFHEIVISEGELLRRPVLG